MASQNTLIEIGRHRIKLSNLQKVLFPASDVLKAEVIQYYLSMAPFLLRHIKYRPLTFIRYPDGIHGESFFQKNRPNFTPEWIQSVKLGKSRDVNYMIATNEASLVWFANLASIEFHQQSIQHPDLTHPDHFIFDLDPPEDMSFDQTIDIALRLRTYLEGYGYTPFAKTSGQKGLHVLVPIQAKYGYDTLKASLKSLALKFVSQNPEYTTIHIRKEKRRSKLFIDILRNSKSQTTACAYSLRANENANVSMPLTWEMLELTKSPNDFTIHTVPDLLNQYGDAWEGFSSHASMLHDQRRSAHAIDTSDALKAYMTKRNFEVSPEPLPQPADVDNSEFVIHRHKATRTHLDLRLMQDGVLRSWALPKGLPPSPNVKHLAIETEDHPASYIDFEGTIPKGTYGAGDIRIIANGNYRITKQKKNGFYFKLNSTIIDVEYRMHLMQEKQWIIERVDPAEFIIDQDRFEPMLCRAANDISNDLEFSYEVKWDGIRAVLYFNQDTTAIWSRGQRDISIQFPELVQSSNDLDCTQVVLDGEIVYLEENGMPNFKKVLGRLNKSKKLSDLAQTDDSQIYYYVFDVLYLDGIKTIKLPLWKRQQLLAQIVPPTGPVRLSEALEDGEALFEATGKAGLEGIIAKRKNSMYTPGSRSENWLKVKHRQTMTCIVVGYTAGEGDRSETFGALHLVNAQHPETPYVGKVGSGFTDKQLFEIKHMLDNAGAGTKPDLSVDKSGRVFWITHTLYCEVEYASVTSNGTLREPVFLRMRADLPA